MSEAFKKESGGFVALESVYLTTDGKIVVEGDSRAAIFLSPKGGRVTDKLGKKLGLATAKIEPIEKKHSPAGFDLKTHGGFNQKFNATIAPEAIAERSTTVERPQRTR